MLQQVTVTSGSNAPLKPLLESAIRGELKTLAHGIARTRERLAAFEQQYGMTSPDFERRFAARELGESLDFIEWLGEIKTLRLLEDRQRTLSEAQIA